MKVQQVNKIDFLHALGGRGRSKYGAKKTTVDGRTYDSKAEAHAAVTLDIKKRRGEILELEYQPRYELIPKPNRVTYVADFRVLWASGIEEIIDIKGMETDVFKIKAKMFRHAYPEKRLRIVKAGDELLQPRAGI